MAEWKTSTVQFNYHIALDGMYYSVPYQYIKKQVESRLTDTAVEVFYGHERIASHARLRGRPGQYSTVKAHMPEGHREYLEWDGDRFRRWASGIGEKTAAVIDALLRAGSVEQQSYRACSSSASATARRCWNGPAARRSGSRAGPATRVSTTIDSWWRCA